MPRPHHRPACPRPDAPRACAGSRAGDNIALHRAVGGHSQRHQGRRPRSLHKANSLRHKTQWQPLLAQAQHQPLNAPDETVISLSIAPDGHVSAMKLEHSTGNAALDKAAWSATTSAHYDPLPAALKVAPLKMRIHFPVH